MLAGRTPRIVAEPCSPMRLLSHCFFFVQHNHIDSITVVGALYLVRPVLATPTRAFVPDALLGLANPAHASAHRWLDCIDFGIDPPVPTPSASTASSPFFYVYDGLDCVDFGIAPFHDDCLDASPSSSWRPSRACSSIDMAIRPQLRRPRPSSARLLRPRLLRPHARLPRHRHKGLPPCMRTHRLLLQPHHMRRIDCYDCRGC